MTSPLHDDTLGRMIDEAWRAAAMANAGIVPPPDFIGARRVLRNWCAHDPVMVDMAWQALADSPLPDDQALVAEVARERVAQMGLDVAALPFNAARFQKLKPPYPEPHVPRGWNLLTWREALHLGLKAWVGLTAMYGTYMLGRGGMLVLARAMGWLP